jgi:hypothetical protein
MTGHMRQKYLRVIHSDRWRFMKRRMIEVRGNKCEGCGDASTPLELHHDTYERLGNEWPSDLRLLCRDCHRAEDIFRAERSRQRASDAYYWGSVSGYMSRRYGEDWDSIYLPNEAEDMYHENCRHREYEGY